MSVAPQRVHVEDRISIRPESGILAVLSHLNYRPWFALAEFVDNSIQSYLTERKRIEAIDGQGRGLEVTIRMDPSADRVTVRDNAGGIAWSDFPRAFKPAQLPPDRSGLSEFGLGMKMAACWFARRWSVRTSALGESVERAVMFDVDEIRRTDAETLTVIKCPESANSHYTELMLEGLNQGVPRKRTLGKIRDHLRDIYRCYTRDGILRLYLETEFFGRELLTYTERAILEAPRYGRNNEPVDSNRLVWRKELDIEFGEGYRAHGFAGILETADTNRAGFALFRRRRLIVGSDDESYRPSEVFGRPNDFAYQRIYGELHIQGLEVAHTKDGFRWGGYEEEFLRKLREALDAEPLRLLKQADNYRSRPKRSTKESTDIRHATEAAADSVAGALNRTTDELTKQAQAEGPGPSEPPDLSPTPAKVHERIFEVGVAGEIWTIRLEYCDDPAQGQLVEVASHPEYDNRRRLAYRVNLAHPFVRAFAGVGYDNLELISFIAAAVVVAEKTTQAAGFDSQAARMRLNISDVLRAMIHART